MRAVWKNPSCSQHLLYAAELLSKLSGDSGTGDDGTNNICRKRCYEHGFGFCPGGSFGFGHWWCGLSHSGKSVCGSNNPNKSLLRFVRTHPDLRALGKACSNGASEMMTNLSASVVGMLYNWQLIRIAGEDGVAAYGVMMYVAFIFMAFFFGYAVGAGPLIGYHYGAANHKELKNLFRKSMAITSIAAVFMTVVSIALAIPLAKIFVGYDQTLCEMTGRGMTIYSLSFLLCGFNIFGSAFFTGLNNGKISAFISFLRTLVLQVLAIIVLPMFWGLDGIWFAVVVAEGLTLVVTFAFLVTQRKSYHY